MKAIAQAAQSILLGDASIVVAGWNGEYEQRKPFYSDAMRWGIKYGHVSLFDGLRKRCWFERMRMMVKPMGIAAELCASTCAVSRAEQHALAIESYQRSQAAVKAREIRQMKLYLLP
jgi:acetyl-CoA C-acetyltransferase